MNDVNLFPGSSTRRTSDPGPDPVFTGSPDMGSPDMGSPNKSPPTGWRAFSSKPVKWTIGRFYCLTRRTRPFLQLWRHGSDFLYTKNSAMGRSDCIYTKNSARPSWGGDASENGDFQSEKQRLQWYNFFQELSFHIIKVGGRCDRKCQFSKWETALAVVQKSQVEF